MALRDSDDPAPVAVHNPGATSPFLLVCDHAGRAVPRALGDLGLPPEALAAHIAWDIGALDLAKGLADRLSASLIHQAYSRLVIDCNRAPDHPGSIPSVSDGWDIPGNQGLSGGQVQSRIAAVHAPYHQAIDEALDRRAAAARKTLLVSMHSFTPALAVGGGPRPWHVGVLHGPHSPASAALLELLRQERDLIVGDNEPYAMAGADYTAPRHAWARGADVLEIEVRQDLISAAAGVERFATLFARLLPQALAKSEETARP